MVVRVQRCNKPPSLIDFKDTLLFFLAARKSKLLEFICIIHLNSLLEKNKTK